MFSFSQKLTLYVCVCEPMCTCMCIGGKRGRCLIPKVMMGLSNLFPMCHDDVDRCGYKNKRT